MPTKKHSVCSVTITWINEPLIRQTKSPKCNGNALDTHITVRSLKNASPTIYEWNGMEWNKTTPLVRLMGLKFDSCLIAGKSKISLSRSLSANVHVQPSICHHVNVNRHFGSFTSYSMFFFCHSFFTFFIHFRMTIAWEWNRSKLVAYQLYTDVGQNGFLLIHRDDICFKYAN